MPHKEFLEGLREVTKEDGALLVFDEVMTGFRIAYGGAQVRSAGPKSAHKPSPSLRESWKHVVKIRYAFCTCIWSRVRLAVDEIVTEISLVESSFGIMESREET